MKPGKVGAAERSAAAHRLGSLDQEHLLSVSRQLDGRGEPIRPRADDDGVVARTNRRRARVEWHAGMIVAGRIGDLHRGHDERPVLAAEAEARREAVLDPALAGGVRDVVEVALPGRGSSG